MKVAGIKVSSKQEADRIRLILGIHASAAACGGISLAWLVALILFTSHEGECGGYEVQHDENLGKWHTSTGDNFYIGYVCERTAAFGCLSGWQSFQGSCYTMVCESREFRRAEEGCEEKGAKLVSITSEAENDLVLELCGRQSCWIGLSRPTGAKAWHWADGTSAGWFGNWTSFSNFASDAAEANQHACLNKGPPERFIEEPVFIVKAVGKFVVPAGLLFLAYLSLKRKSVDLAQCLCIVDGFFAACLFAEMVIMIFRIMKGGPWSDVIAYIFFMAIASCGVASCCACSAKALKGMKAHMKMEKASPSETESMMRDAKEHSQATQARRDSEEDIAEQMMRKYVTPPSPKVVVHMDPPEATPHQHHQFAPFAQVETTVTPQALGNVEVEVGPFDDYEVEEDAVPQMPQCGHGSEFARELTVESRETSREQRLDHL
jgi:hypothetical protein